MSAKEKAKEIFGNMYDVDKGKGAGNYMNYDYARKCAKIACDEIISLIFLYPQGNEFSELQTKKFWFEVKKEIDLL
jgi:hypothetical protein